MDSSFRPDPPLSTPVKQLIAAENGFPSPQSPGISHLRLPVADSKLLTPLSEVRKKFRGIQECLDTLNKRIHAAAKTISTTTKPIPRRGPLKVTRMPSPIKADKEGEVILPKATPPPIANRARAPFTSNFNTSTAKTSIPLRRPSMPRISTRTTASKNDTTRASTATTKADKEVEVILPKATPAPIANRARAPFTSNFNIPTAKTSIRRPSVPRISTRATALKNDTTRASTITTKAAPQRRSSIPRVPSASSSNIVNTTTNIETMPPRERRPSISRISTSTKNVSMNRVRSQTSQMILNTSGYYIPRRPLPSLAKDLLNKMSPKNRNDWATATPKSLKEKRKSARNQTEARQLQASLEASTMRLGNMKLTNDEILKDQPNNQPSTTVAPSSERTEPIREKQWGREDFKFIGPLGQGGFGIVDKALAVRGGMHVAIKSISLMWLIESNALSLIKTEIEIQSELKHRNVIKLHGYFCDKDRLSIIMDVGEKGDLFDRISMYGRLDEHLTAKIVCQLSDALSYCHSRNVIHRDLKPENVLLDKADNALLSDFGWSTRVDVNEIRTTFCGTFDYMAPELTRRQPYDKTVDNWALGILCFECLDGRPPFSGNLTFATPLKIPFTDAHTKLARDLIGALVQEKPKDRFSLEEVKNHDWVQKHCPDALALTKSRPDLIWGPTNT